MLFQSSAVGILQLSASVPTWDLDMATGWQWAANPYVKATN